MHISSAVRKSSIAVLALSFLMVSTVGTALAATPPKTTPAATRIAQVPSSFATTNATGDILTTNIAILGTTRAVMVGGNFTSLTTPDGRVHAATNFAILDLNNPNRVVYKASGVNSYVRESYAHAGVLYVAGDFTSFGGQPRARLAALRASDLRLLPWNPGASSRVEALMVNNNAVFYGGNEAKLRAVAPALSATPGRLIWSKDVSAGAVRAMTMSPSRNELYVGGLFERVGGTGQHGLVKLRASDGANDGAFRPQYRPDSGIGEKGTWDGDCVMSLQFDATNNKLVVGSGGAFRNMITYISASSGSGVNAAWAVAPSTGAIRNSEGDVQAVAIVGDIIAMGYHRSHTNNNTVWPTKRMLTMWNKADGSIQGWDGGLWGVKGNADGGNGGVQAMAYDAGSKKLVVGGAFKGYGDPYNNTGGTDLNGEAGTVRHSLAVYTVQ